MSSSLLQSHSLADRFHATLSLCPNNSSSGQMLGHSHHQIMPLTPSSPTAKRIIARGEAEKRVKEKRSAFKTGGKSRSLGNAEHILTSLASAASAAHSQQQPTRAPALATRSESVNRHQNNQLHPLRVPNQMLRKSSDAIYGSGKKNQQQQLPPFDGISPHSQQIIQFCLENARGDLSARVLSRMAHKRPDFALFCANLGVESWPKFGEQFRHFLADVVANLHSTETIRHFSMKFGSDQVNWRSYGFKADFFSEIASALTTECVFLDGAAHPPTDAFEAWAELVEMMFSAVRDGYYSRVRHLRRNNNFASSLGYSQSMLVAPSRAREQQQQQRGRTANGREGGVGHGLGHNSLEI